MKLRARKPEVKEARLQTLIYSGEGVGKTHFCCSFPDTYYIDTEGLDKYPHLVKMLKDNGGDMVYLTELSDIIDEVKALLSTKHNYKTLVIDSISFPYGWLSQMEADRLSKKGAGSEGTEFGANLAKAKRLTFQLGILLSRLDMNVIVTAHEKVKYEKGVEIGSTYDITDKMAYAIGAVWNLKQIGKSRKLFIKKSRYPLMQAGDTLDFDDGYEVIKSIFGEIIFKREAKIEELATKDQIDRFIHFKNLLHLTDEEVNKMLTTGKATALEELTKDYMQKVINRCEQKLQGEAA